jgi:uncharacterized membrane protein
MPRILLAVFVALMALTACGEDDPPACPEGEEGPPTEATCNGSPLTYENFGQEFMENYCTRCHSSEVKGDARHCAPSDHNFDTLDEIVFYSDHIDEWAAAGPNGVNEGMPPDGAKPTEAERLDLGTWLACELERMP